MCGHFGIAGPGILQNDLDVFKELGQVSEIFRGQDGAGVYQVKSHPLYKGASDFELVYKTDGLFSNLLNDLDDADFKKRNGSSLLNTMAVDVIIGHVRAATRGSITEDNAHPFTFNNLVGAHNGTLKDKKYESKDKTDSEMMFEDISKRGLLPVIKELDQNSAWAIVMFDRTNRKLYFGRNRLRPLHFALHKTRNVLYWASEPDFLKLVLRRRNIDFYPFSMKENSIWEVEPDKIPSHNVFEKSKKSIFKVIYKPEEEKKEEPPFDGGTKREVVVSQGSKGNVVDLFKTNNFTAFHEKCVCGKKTLNLLMKDRAKKGKLVGYSYDKESDTYHCDNCAKTEIKNGTVH